MDTVRDKIISYLKPLDYPVSAKNIARFTKLNPNSVRPELSNLVKEGILVKPFYGYYSTNLGYDQGMVLEPPRVQNLLVVAEGVDVIDHQTVVREFGDDEDSETLIRVSVVFGVKRGRISWRVKAPLGVDIYGLRLCRGLVEEICGGHGYSGMIWHVKNYDLLNDFLGMRLEGVNALTLTDFEGTLEKFYNRRGGVRREVCSSKHTSIESLIALTRGGLPTYHVIQGVYYVGRKVEELTDSVKHGNRFQIDMVKQLQAIVVALYRIIDWVGGSDPDA